MRWGGSAPGSASPWPVPLADVAAAIAAFLSPALRTRNTEAAPVPAGRLALQLWQAAQRGVANDEAGLVAAVEPLAETIEELTGCPPPGTPPGRAPLPKRGRPRGHGKRNSRNKRAWSSV